MKIHRRSVSTDILLRADEEQNSETQNTHKMNTQSKIADLKKQLDLIYSEMPETFFQQQQRDKSAFLITRELEMLENPEDYATNQNHWEGYEIRF